MTKPIDSIPPMERARGICEMAVFTGYPIKKLELLRDLGLIPFPLGRTTARIVTELWHAHAGKLRSDGKGGFVVVVEKTGVRLKKLRGTSVRTGRTKVEYREPVNREK